LLNYREAFDLVTECLDSGEPITEALIREIHKRLVKGVRGDKASPGRYRKGRNFVVNSKTKQVIYTPPPPAEVPGMMEDMVNWLRSEHGVNAVLEAGTRATTSSVFSRSANTTTATDPLSTKPSRPSGKRVNPTYSDPVRAG
jgi:hypothetical protein